MKMVVERFDPFKQIWWDHDEELLVKLKAATAKTQKTEMNKMKEALCQK